MASKKPTPIPRFTGTGFVNTTPYQRAELLNQVRPGARDFLDCPSVEGNTFAYRPDAHNTPQGQQNAPAQSKAQ